MIVLMRSTGMNRTTEALPESEIALRILSTSLAIAARTSVLHLEQTHALVGEDVGVEQGDQLHRALDLTPAVEDEQEICGCVGDGLGAFADERLDDLGHFRHGGVLEEDEVEHELVVFGD